MTIPRCSLSAVDIPSGQMEQWERCPWYVLNSLMYTVMASVLHCTNVFFFKLICNYTLLIGNNIC